MTLIHKHKMSNTFIADPEDIICRNLFYPMQAESTCSSGNDAFLCTEDTEAAETRSTSKVVTHTQLTLGDKAQWTDAAHFHSLEHFTPAK